MGRVESRSIKLRITVGIVAAALLAAAPAPAQPAGNAEAKLKVSGLVKEAMDAYSNLDLAAATGSLEEALGYAPDLDKTTLARLYIAYGTIRIGGQGDNAGGQRDFATALCLDPGVMIDPLMSTPDIDAVFTMAKQQATPANCPQILSMIVLPADMKPGGGTASGGGAGDPGVPPCGQHTPITDQKQRYELPVYMSLDPAMRARLARLVVKFAFDGGKDYRELVIAPAGPGFGAQITCDEGQIRLYDPTAIDYYIEGFDRLGNLICGHATAQAPYVVNMSPDAPPVPGAPGMPVPKECTQCPPWDTSCGQGARPGDGEMCDPAVGCAEGFECGEAGICQASGGAGGDKGPKRFYVNVHGGVGFGFMSQSLKYNQISHTSEAGNEINPVDVSTTGGAFSGGMARLVVGVQILKWLSVEIGGRIGFFGFSDAQKDYQSCWEATGGDEDWYNGTGSYEGEGASCTDYPASGSNPKNADPTNPEDPNYFTEDEAKKSIALDDNGSPVFSQEKMVGKSWIANARARFTFLDKGALKLAAFAGLGYGHLIYRLKGSDGNYYFVPGFFDIEVGPALTFYFTDNFGLSVEVPIDIVVGDGWAVNFDVAAGLSFGF